MTAAAAQVRQGLQASHGAEHMHCQTASCAASVQLLPRNLTLQMFTPDMQGSRVYWPAGKQHLTLGSTAARSTFADNHMLRLANAHTGSALIRSVQLVRHMSASGGGGRGRGAGDGPLGNAPLGSAGVEPGRHEPGPDDDDYDSDDFIEDDEDDYDDDEEGWSQFREVDAKHDDDRDDLDASVPDERFALPRNARAAARQAAYAPVGPEGGDAELGASAANTDLLEGGSSEDEAVDAQAQREAEAALAEQAKAQKEALDEDDPLFGPDGARCATAARLQSTAQVAAACVCTSCLIQTSLARVHARIMCATPSTTCFIILLLQDSAARGV
jgi:hypothetical protein